jgi:hypothetical protein
MSSSTSGSPAPPFWERLRAAGCEASLALPPLLDWRDRLREPLELEPLALVAISELSFA